MVMLSHVKIVVCICMYSILYKILLTLNGYTGMLLGHFFHSFKGDNYCK